MPLSIKDPETERLARELAKRTGQTITAATRKALEDGLRKAGTSTRREAMIEDLASIRRRWSALPVLDPREAEAILDYDDDGLPR